MAIHSVNIQRRATSPHHNVVYLDFHHSTSIKVHLSYIKISATSIPHLTDLLQPGPTLENFIT